MKTATLVLYGCVVLLDAGAYLRAQDVGTVMQAPLPAVRPSELRGWLYLGRITDDLQWAPDSPKNVEIVDPTVPLGVVLRLKDDAFLHSDSEPLKHADAPVLVSLSEGQLVKVLDKDFSHAIVGGDFVWVKVQQIDNSVEALRSTLTARVLLAGSQPFSDLGITLLAIDRVSLLPVRTRISFEAQTVEDIYKSELRLPTFPREIQDVARAMNSSREVTERLPAGVEVRIPDVSLSPYETVAKYNTSLQSDREQFDALRRVRSDFQIEQVGDDPHFMRIKLTGYVLTFDVATRHLNEVIDAISSLKLPGIQIANQRAEQSNKRLQFKVKFEGGDYVHDMETVLAILLHEKLIAMATAVIEQGDTLEGLYKRLLGVPVSLVNLAKSLNPRLTTPTNIPTGTSVKYPQVRFATYSWTSFPKDQRYTLVEEHWKSIILSTFTENGRKGFVLQGYLITIQCSSEEDLNRARNALSKVTSASVVLVFPGRDSPERFYSIIESGDKFYSNRVLNLPHRADLGIQGLIASYADISDTSEFSRNCTGDQCPEIVLIDKVLFMHPDFSAAVVPDPGSPTLNAPAPIDSDNKQILEAGSALEVDHGTEMAGIIACQDNDFGFIGIDPHARLIPVDASILRVDPDSLVQMMQRRIHRESVYVLATEWTLSTKSGLATADSLHNEKSRFQDDLARTIRDAKPLIVGAAGQEPTSEARNITTTYSKGPMSLGDLPNVIIVTACTQCYGSGASLMDRMNYSKDLVALAAPGDSIPTTIDGTTSGGKRFGKYALMSGTSPATAIVAGVASSMIGKWPFFRRSPEFVKFWLEVTSRPLAGNQVQSGIIEPSVAILDPQRSYLDQNSGSLKAFQPSHWCTDTITVVDENQRKTAIATSNIYRLRRTANSDDKWFVYSSDDPTKSSGSIAKYGPDTVSVADGKLIQAGADVYLLKDIDDLLLSADPNAQLAISKCN